ncbi:BatB protein [Candidatus Thiomargarita nelsonii]|uniref:BatB protein n=1 Tax=Candidatus Thiomargarita nelsonii TaxID=1003181 RepID=A0A0A6RVS6_9GAMM|nr:BatB protein [Candidatus Thiomargarita nelsonii]
MIHFEWPWLFLALPLPLIVRYLLPATTSVENAALRVPFIEDFQSLNQKVQHKTIKRWPLWLATLAWILLVIAATRPQWWDEPIELPINGRDLMMAVDLSGSMRYKDFRIQDRTVDRLTATKWVAAQFIERRVGDRLGLILFGDQAYLQVPLTFDRQTVRTLLNESAIGLAGKQTAIGDAIGLAVKRFLHKNKKNQESWILILLTDGVNTPGKIEPLKVAELAAQEGLKIYTIGIGADEMVLRDFFGTRRINPSVDLDEKTLKQIAEKTGGRYFRARDTAGLEKIYALLDELEPIQKDNLFFRPTKALYYWPLSMALLLSAIIIVFSSFGLTHSD